MRYWLQIYITYAEGLLMGYILGIGLVIALPILLNQASQHWDFFDIRFIWYDLWVGIYIDIKNKKVYICPLPTLVFIIDIGIIIKCFL